MLMLNANLSMGASSSAELSTASNNNVDSASTVDQYKARLRALICIPEWYL